MSQSYDLMGKYRRWRAKKAKQPLLLAFCLLFLTASCSGLEDGEQRRLRRSHAEGEYIYRKAEESLYTIPPLSKTPRPDYPWEKSYIHDVPRITREFFRCRGNSLNPTRLVDKSGEVERLCDCDGHGLPMVEGKEFVYPILIDLLNHLQEKTGRRVVITCGHRCPHHNRYADPRPFNQTSKHMIGAEVDFYVEGYEERPLEVVQIVMDYYADQPAEYSQFLRYDKGNTDVSTHPWYNKEIFVKLYHCDEGRDFDNRHPYPYIGVQVRYDRMRDERVIYTWEQAHNYFR